MTVAMIHIDHDKTFTVSDFHIDHRNNRLRYRSIFEEDEISYLYFKDVDINFSTGIFVINVKMKEDNK